MSALVTVTGLPTLALNDGGSATYNAAASTSTNLVFNTTITAGQNVDALAITGVNLPAGASIRDTAGNDADLSGATKTFNGLEVDTVAPVVSSPTLAVVNSAAATSIGITAPTDAGSSAAQLAITVASLPSNGAVFLADGVTAVTSGETLSAGQLTGLLFKPAAGQPNTSSAFTYTVADPATNASTGIATLAIGPAPVITGTVANQPVSDAATLDPFSGVTVTDANVGQTETVTITQNAAGNGVLTDPNAASDGDSVAGNAESLSGTAAQVTVDLHALVFTPTAHQVAPDSSVTTGFTLGSTDTVGATASNALTSVVVTATETPPVISGTLAGQAINDQQTLHPFTTATIADPDFGASETTAITLSDGGIGGILAGTGLSQTAAGTYVLAAASPAIEQAELRALTFTPASGHVATGNTVTTQATLSVSDGMQTATDTATTIAVTQAATGTASGDVHMVTLDGLHYDSQADGDFTLERSTMAGNSFDIQIRTAPWTENNQASLTMQAAAQIGDSVVSFTPGGGVTINGISHTALDATHPVQMLDGGSLTMLGAGNYQLDWANGEGLSVSDEGFYLNLHATVAATNGPGSVQGLLGSLQGQGNDFALPDGTVLTQPVPDADLVGMFASAWSVGSSSMLNGGGPAIKVPPLGLSGIPSFVTATAPDEVLTGSLGATTATGVVIQGSLATLAGGVITNLAARDVIDLTGAQLTAADLHYASSPMGGVLTITEESAAAQLTIMGQPPATTIQSTPDPYGGTLIRLE